MPTEKKSRQQQEQRLLHQVERLNTFLKEYEPKVGKGLKEIQSNITDAQST